MNNKYADNLDGLTYYGVRYYDRFALVWTQNDPLYRFAPDLANAPRHANLYTFSLNNPLRYLDPDGRDNALDIVETTASAAGNASGNSGMYQTAADAAGASASNAAFQQCKDDVDSENSCVCLGERTSNALSADAAAIGAIIDVAQHDGPSFFLDLSDASDATRSTSSTPRTTLEDIANGNGDIPDPGLPALGAAPGGPGGQVRHRLG